MLAESAWPTIYPDVNAILCRWLAEARVILGNQLVGMYLYGSLAGGDFNPATSDIDVVMVTSDHLDDTQVTALGALHRRLAESGMPWADKLEGSYIAQSALRRYDPADTTPWPTLNEGQFYMAPHGWDWVIQRHLVYEQGVVVAGPPPQILIDPVTPDEIRHAVAALLAEWWAPMLTDLTRLQRTDYQVYAILSMCRSLHALHHGTIVSKPAAARWAQQALGETIAGIIGAALVWHKGQPFDHLDDARDLIRMALTYPQSLERR